MTIFRLGELADVFAGKPATRLKPGPDRVGFLTMRNIEDGLFTTGATDQVPASASEIGHFAVRAGDLLASVRGTFRIAAVAPEHTGSLPGANTAVIRFHEPAAAVAVAAYLRHPEVAARLQSAFFGSTVPGISLDDLRATPLRVPPPERLAQLVELVAAGEMYHAAILEAAEKRRMLMLDVVRQALGEEAGA